MNLSYFTLLVLVSYAHAQPSPPKSVFGMSQCTSDSDGFVTVGCLARGFSPADSLTFKWKDTNKDLSEFVQYPSFGQDGDYTKISHMRIRKSDWVPENPYTCQATNSEGSREAKVEVRDGKTPSVFIYKPDNIGTGPVSHVCEVTSPNLGDVYIMWKLADGHYREGRTSAPIHQKDSKSVLSILTVSKEEYENLKAIITCAVKHANMNNISAPLQESTSKSEPPEPENGCALDCNKDVEEEDEFRSLWSTATSFIFLFLFSLTYSAVLSFFKVKQ
ncbi:hypothetical protein G5714_003515 [Onychostoma macrolepis]|uniref:Ig-like domain-containing protein n=1 Tax=Onychostoma macrolepis TaxID=369639 RepID=A0A7J6D9P5_9TELE|nr:hypothetical protein G5714_003515 [Onychostoma macrolepis]